MLSRQRLFRLFSIPAFLLITWSSLGADITLIHSFDKVGTALDTPGALVLAGNMLVGTSTGTSDTIHGTIFQLTLDGTRFSTLYTFHGGNADAASSFALLPVHHGLLYGTSAGGGRDGNGTVYSFNSSGKHFAIMHDFPNEFQDGKTFNVNPESLMGGLTKVGSELYGMTEFGGGQGNHEHGGAGVIYRINCDDKSFGIIHAFAGGKKDGENPLGQISAIDNVLYGLTQTGGIANEGVLFRIKPDGTDFEILHSFGTNKAEEGFTPEGSLAQVGSTLFGTTNFGGHANRGACFKFDIPSGVLAALHGFADAPEKPQYPGDFTVAGSYLYGYSMRGGTSDAGSIYRLRPDGSGFEILHSFAGSPSDGSIPLGRLIVTESAVYGIASRGGANDAGCVYKLPAKAE